MNSQIINKLENSISIGKKILVYCNDVTELFDEILLGLVNEPSCFEIWIVPECRNLISKLKEYNDITYRVLDEAEAQAILNLHHMYDFSDKVMFVTNSGQYGSLKNYICQGIVTTNEIVKGLF